MFQCSYVMRYLLLNTILTKCFTNNNYYYVRLSLDIIYPGFNDKPKTQVINRCILKISIVFVPCMCRVGSKPSLDKFFSLREHLNIQHVYLNGHTYTHKHIICTCIIYILIHVHVYIYTYMFFGSIVCKWSFF